jgi:hypothetical protein
MPTSNSWNYSVTASQIITSAAEDIGAIANGQTINSNDFATMLRTLNLLVKQWQGTSDKFPGLKVWTRQRLILYFVSGQARYLVGPASTDDRSSTSQVITTLTTAKAANALAAVVASTTGMTAGDQIGFVTSAGTLGWTTITTVTNGTDLVLPANTVGAADSGALVFTYTNKAQRFVELEAVSLRDWSTPGQPIDIPLEVYTDVQQYEAVTQKNASGDPTAILVEYQRINTAITLNFAAANVYKTLRATVIYPSEDYDDATGADDIAYPQEYYAALEWELARRCAPKFGRVWTDDLARHWEIAVKEGVNFNPGDTSLHFEPERDATDVGSPFTRP